VAEDTNNTPRAFDVRTIKALVSLMSQHDLSEIDLQEGDRRIQLRRGVKTATVAAPVIFPSAPPAQVLAHPPATGGGQAAAPAAPDKSHLIEIKSPAVGTFYAQAKPGEPPFVTVGSRVTPETTVGVIMAMKVHNDIPAGCSGVIREILVENDQFVEFDKVLFLVDPTA
jgi:acetyl-CoA carboxylase biotin carboxyl carrier protein